MQDDRHVLISSHYGPKDFHTVHDRHHYVEDDEAWLQMAQHQDCLCTVGGMLYLVTLVAQFVREQLHKIVIIIDDQNYLFIIIHSNHPLKALPPCTTARYLGSKIYALHDGRANPDNIIDDVPIAD